MNPASRPDNGPQQWIEAYLNGQLTGEPVDPAFQEKVHKRLDEIAEFFLGSPRAAEVFLKILSHHGPVAPTLRSMQQSGFLCKYIPEFGRVVSLRSQDASHRFAVGEHTLVAIEVLDECKSGEYGGEKGRYSEAFHHVRRSELLYLAALLHDTGKGLGSDHEKKGGSLVSKVCTRLHLKQEDAETIRFLVENHLLMAFTSQRRNLDDLAVIDGFVRILGQQERLHMLFLLTHADAAAVGPDIWNAWKDTLLYELYIRTRQRFWEKTLGIEPEGIPSWKVGQQAVEFLEPSIGHWELEEHVERMPASYFRFLHPEDLARHVEVVHRVRVEKEAAALQWAQDAPRHCRVLHVCTYDRLGLFADIAGVLAAHGLSVLNAAAYTRKDGIVLDFFWVAPVQDSSTCSPEKEQEVEEALKGMLAMAPEGECTVPALTEPPLRSPRQRPLITVSNDVSQQFTVLEIEAHDVPGLLYAIARSLTRMGLDISMARVTTEGDRALDVFYVADVGGGQVRDPQRLWAIKKALEEDLTGKAGGDQ